MVSKLLHCHLSLLGQEGKDGCQIYYQCIIYCLVLCVHYQAYNGWALRKIFKIKGLRWLENAILKLDFVNTIFHRRAILLIFQAEFIERLLGNLSHPGSTIGPTMAMPEKSFQNKGFQIAGKCCPESVP